MRTLLLQPDQVVTIDPPQACVATVQSRSLLGGGPAALLNQSPPAGLPVVMQTGSFAECDGGGVFDPHPRTWSTHGWAALVEACDQATRAFSGVIVVRPHARHVLSDVPSLRRFAAHARERHPDRFQLLLDPVSMLEPVHLSRKDAGDFIARTLEEADTIGLKVFGIVAAGASLIDGEVNMVRLGDGDAPSAHAFAAAAKRLDVPLVVIDAGDAVNPRLRV